MDISTILVLVVTIGSIFLVGELAREWGRSPSRWIWTAMVIGPFAIPLFFLAVATSALRKTTAAPKP
jgi:hypothetical protein